MLPLFRLVLPVLAATPQRWIQLAERLPPELFQRKPGPEGVVGIRLFTAHRGHGEIGVPCTHRVSAAR